MGTFDPRGVNPELVFALRKALDEEGFTHVKIMVSGGFTEERINHFEALGVPVDMYGVGGSLLQINIGFTGDNVLLNGTSAAKEGRSYRPNPRLKRVEYRKQDKYVELDVAVIIVKLDIDSILHFFTLEKKNILFYS